MLCVRTCARGAALAASAYGYLVAPHTVGALFAKWQAGDPMQLAKDSGLTAALVFARADTVPELTVHELNAVDAQTDGVAGSAAPRSGSVTASKLQELINDATDTHMMVCELRSHGATHVAVALHVHDYLVSKQNFDPLASALVGVSIPRAGAPFGEVMQDVLPNGVAACVANRMVYSYKDVAKASITGAVRRVAELVPELSIAFVDTVIDFIWDSPTQPNKIPPLCLDTLAACRAWV
jgi:hypothetical protein